ncbi:MAG: hypothetical protein WBG86_19120 [Polyangiales bacterium]
MTLAIVAADSLGGHANSEGRNVIRREITAATSARVPAQVVNQDQRVVRAMESQTQSPKQNAGSLKKIERR